MDSAPLLKGIRVIDLSQFIPGPYATFLMASLGADVVKVEPPSGDPMRALMCSNDSSISPVYESINAGKKIIRLDLKSGQGKSALWKILEKADVMLDGYRPGVLTKLGFAEDQINTINPALIHCSLSGYGLTGPYRLKAGHDINYCALAGMYTHIKDETVPVIQFPLIADHVGGLQAVNAILAGLLRKERTGQGCHLDIALYEGLLSWQYAEKSAGLRAQLSGEAACYNIYQTADNGLITLGALEFHFWKRFCESLGFEDWINRYYDETPQSSLIGEVKSVISSRPLKYWMKLLDQVDCCFEAVPSTADVISHCQAASRDVINQSTMSYPGWVDGSPVPHSPKLKEIEGFDELGW